MANPTTLTVDDPHAPEAPASGDHGHGGDGHHGELMLKGHDGQMHPAHLQHHFISAEQQFEASKLGMWLFLVTEVLLFGGMFVAYAIYRAWYPDLFQEASTQLDTLLGAFNTLVLLASSLTVAWAIRAAQTDNRKLLVGMLWLTVVLAGFFMVVKYFEYTHKFELGIYPGKYFQLDEGTPTIAELTAGTAVLAPAAVIGEDGQQLDVTEGASGESPTGEAEQIAPGAVDMPEANPEVGAERSLEETEDALAEATGHAADGEHEEGHGREGAIFSNPRAGIFFSIYYVMTGIHGLHIIIGMIAMGILALKAQRGRYTSVYYTPVENVGLYWHIVDIIWIFLFPLMYLI